MSSEKPFDKHPHHAAICALEYAAISDGGTVASLESDIADINGSIAQLVARRDEMQARRDRTVKSIAECRKTIAYLAKLGQEQGDG